eukprot:CAMPEP_0182441858 /NCGR_PEP_ID=MMETSP1172-20130603/861_1 /TAXON_ID=708627 /ORGANISM="Timspurckia oligopyrenoides, Strain CCMP3278" /LENGTH=968 /DNA_ID=CAMNT_0024636439 /DNA_START=87 /DNA_END=2993 /DNA_ORIENTATION=-
MKEDEVRGGSFGSFQNGQNPDNFSSSIDWRQLVSLEDRKKVCYHVLQKLAKCFPNAKDDALTEKAVLFERTVWTNAPSKAEYLRQVAEGLTNVEKRLLSTSQNNSSQHQDRISDPNQTPQTSGGQQNTSNAHQFHAQNQQRQQQTQTTLPPDPQNSGISVPATQSQQLYHQQTEGTRETSERSQRQTVQRGHGPGRDRTASVDNPRDSFSNASPNKQRAVVNSKEINHASKPPQTAHGYQVIQETDTILELSEAKAIADAAAAAINQPGKAWPPRANFRNQFDPSNTGNPSNVNRNGAVQAPSSQVPAQEAARAGRTALPQHLRDAIAKQQRQSYQERQQPGVGSPTVEQNKGNSVQQASPAAANTGVRAAVAGAPASSVPSDRQASEELFWQKLEVLQQTYREPLERLIPYIEALQEKHSTEEKRDQFMRHLRDCTNILKLKRMPSLPSKLSAELLDRASKFIHQVVQVYSEWIFRNYENTSQGAGAVGLAGTVPPPTSGVAAAAGFANAALPGASARVMQTSETFAGTENNATSNSQSYSTGNPKKRKRYASRTGTGNEKDSNKLAKKSSEKSQSSSIGVQAEIGTNEKMIGAKSAFTDTVNNPDSFNPSYAMGSQNAQRVNSRGNEALSKVNANAHAKAEGAGQSGALYSANIPDQVLRMEAEVRFAIASASRMGHVVARESQRLQLERVQNTIFALRPSDIPESAEHAASNVLLPRNNLLINTQTLENSNDRRREMNLLLALPITNCSSRPSMVTLPGRTVFESEPGQRVKLKSAHPERDVFQCGLDVRNPARERQVRLETIVAEIRDIVAKYPSGMLRLRLGELVGIPVLCVDTFPLTGLIRPPSLTLRVSRSYPIRGSVFTEFGKPYFGWSPELCELKSRFNASISRMPPMNAGGSVAAVLDAWLSEIVLIERKRYNLLRQDIMQLRSLRRENTKDDGCAGDSSPRRTPTELMNAGMPELII